MIPLKNILFLDIETVPQHQNLADFSPVFQKLWQKKAALLAKNGESAEDLFPRAGIYAEFGKIICISVGIINPLEGENEIRIKSFFGDDEKSILQEFAGLLNSHYAGKEHHLCGHNGKEFDFPYLSRRMLIHGIKLPKILSTAGKKPWETQFLDTLELWKFGDYKNFTSLDLLAAVFGLESPKENMDGSEVYPQYYQEKNLEGIKDYCERDVKTLIDVYLKLTQEN